MAVIISRQIMYVCNNITNLYQVSNNAFCFFSPVHIVYYSQECNPLSINRSMKNYSQSKCFVAINLVEKKKKKTSYFTDSFQWSFHWSLLDFYTFVPFKSTFSTDYGLCIVQLARHMTLLICWLVLPFHFTCHMTE